MSEVLKSQSIAWAQEVLLKKDKYVILDSETTGLKKNDVIVQLAVIDLNGNEHISVYTSEYQILKSQK